MNEETIKKRLQRARSDLIDHDVSLDPPADNELEPRLAAVHQVLYLLFNEGYSASRGEAAIRADLCEDAAWLCHLLCSHARFSTPATYALMALMLDANLGKFKGSGGRFPAFGPAACRWQLNTGSSRAPPSCEICQMLRSRL